MKKNGFVSMTLVYTFLIVFLFLMLAILSAYSEKNKFIDAINSQIDEDISESKDTKYTLLNKILMDNTAIEDTSLRYYDISNLRNGNGNGLFYTDSVSITDENNDGNGNRIYFFRGEVNNNNVVFADMCFRIMRTNENGSIRLRYNGEYVDRKCPSVADLKAGLRQAYVDDAETGTKYNSNVSVEKAVGYVYSTSGEAVYGADNQYSTVKEKVDLWYVNNILLKSFNGYISDSYFCNGRTGNTIGNIKYYDIKSFVPIKDDGYIHNIATFKCNQRADRFNLALTSFGTDEEGNNLLTYPVGIPTVADVVFAGGYITDSNIDNYNGGDHGMTNDKYYMNIGTNYWTMSPFYNDNSTSVAKVATVDADGVIRATNINSTAYVVPVISINAGSQIKSGIGTYNDPYIIN